MLLRLAEPEWLGINAARLQYNHWFRTGQPIYGATYPSAVGTYGLAFSCTFGVQQLRIAPLYTMHPEDSIVVKVVIGR